MVFLNVHMIEAGRDTLVENEKGQCVIRCWQVLSLYQRIPGRILV